MKKLNSYSWVMIFTGILLAEIFFALGMGSVKLSGNEIYETLFQGIQSNMPVTAPRQGPVHDIVWLLRFPRLLLAAATGAGLAVCGTVIQAVVKNPLADPYILGISSGASLGAVLSIFLGAGIFFGPDFIGICSFAGAFSISLLVLIISQMDGKPDTTKLLLTGMAVNMACSSISSFIVYFANDKDGIQTILFWLMGSFAGAQWSTLQIIIPVVCFGIIFFWTQNRTLDIMLLGDHTAVTLGTDLSKYRHVYLLMSAFIVGFLVYSAGMIGFVGLIIPHIVRIFTGTGHRYLLPLAALLGAVLLVAADVISRILITGTDIPVGIIVSLLGAPGFVFLTAKKSYSFGGKN